MSPSITPTLAPTSHLLSSQMLPAETPHQNAKQGQAILIWTIGAYCVFGWELILCLPREYRLVWKRPMNVSSALYLVNRYFGLVKFSFAISLFSGVWALETCKRIFYFQPVGGLISTLVSQMILGGRVYAIFGKNRVIGWSLLVMLVVEAVVCGLAISKIFPPPLSFAAIAAAKATGQPLCGVLTGPFGWLVTFWTMPLLFDTVTFILTASRAYTLWKTQMNTGTHGLFNVIWRDGLLYFFAIFSMNVVNVVIFLTTPREVRAVNLPATLVLEVMLSCRLVLNLRETHSHSAQLRSHPRPGALNSNMNMQTSIKLRSVSEHSQPHSFDKTAAPDLEESPHSPDRKGDVDEQQPWSAA